MGKKKGKKGKKGRRGKKKGKGKVLRAHPLHPSAEPRREDGLAPLLLAMSLNDCAATASLLRAGASARVAAALQEPLIAASEKGHVEVVELLLAAAAADDVDHHGKLGLTALQLAAARGHGELACGLLHERSNLGASCPLLHVQPNCPPVLAPDNLRERNPRVPHRLCCWSARGRA